VLKLLAFVLPLGLDSFAVAAAIGAARAMTARQRLRISLIFVIFEGGMPLIGLGLGTAVARGTGQAAGYLAGAAVIAIGAWMLLAGDSDEEEKASRIPESRACVELAVTQPRPDHR
jgi:manganese efflux pump family protein